VYIGFEMAYNKIQKYVKLAYELKRQWQVELSIILSAAGVVPKNPHKSLKLLNPIKGLCNNIQVQQCFSLQGELSITFAIYRTLVKPVISN
jgi:hypothetical protein